jgi:hypothetical protein
MRLGWAALLEGRCRGSLRWLICIGAGEGAGAVRQGFGERLKDWSSVL